MIFSKIKTGEQHTGAWVTDKVIQNADPAKWMEHRYGLTPERWNRLKGKSFWITGAGTGYGRCLSIALASAGAHVFLTGRRKEKLFESLAKIKSLGISINNCCIVEADITDIEQIKRACNKIKGLCSSLYGLINNAALPPREIFFPLQDETLDYWNRLMRTNVTAPWLLTREIFLHMKIGGEVRVLFMTSESGWAFTSGFGPYNISKSALNNLSASLAKEYSTSFPDMDIQMNAIVPGEARTEMNQNSAESPFSVVSMALILLSHPQNGPNGMFFHRDGRHLQFAYSLPYNKPLI